MAQALYGFAVALMFLVNSLSLPSGSILAWVDAAIVGYFVVVSSIIAWTASRK